MRAFLSLTFTDAMSFYRMCQEFQFTEFEQILQDDP